MSLVLELLGDIMIGAGIASGTIFLKSRSKKKVSVCSDGTLPWSIYQTGERHGFRCPKCINVHKNKTQMPYCECEEYHDGHFHFKCGDCGYQNIVRTADVP